MEAVDRYLVENARGGGVVLLYVVCIILGVED